MAEGDGRKEEKGSILDAREQPSAPNSPSPRSILARHYNAHRTRCLRGPRVTLCTMAEVRTCPDLMRHRTLLTSLSRFRFDWLEENCSGLCSVVRETLKVPEIRDIFIANDLTAFVQ